MGNKKTIKNKEFDKKIGEKIKTLIKGHGRKLESVSMEIFPPKPNKKPTPLTPYMQGTRGFSVYKVFQIASLLNLTNDEIVYLFRDNIETQLPSTPKRPELITNPNTSKIEDEIECHCRIIKEHRWLIEKDGKARTWFKGLFEVSRDIEKRGKTIKKINTDIAN